MLSLASQAFLRLIRIDLWSNDIGQLESPQHDAGELERAERSLLEMKDRIANYRFHSGSNGVA